MAEMIHAFQVSRAYPGGFMWACLCGLRIFQHHDELPASIHSRLLFHANGEDGMQPCPHNCGRAAGTHVKCSEED